MSINFINSVFANLKKGSDNIWGEVSNYGEQKLEQETRLAVANQTYSNYLSEIALHHSIPVMDGEIKKFLNNIPKGGLILDIGGCWGWHWRNINETRPDVTVVILDLVRENLLHAKLILKDKINNNIFLVHGNACMMEFDDEIFDGIWSVQATQHIPNFEICCKEIYRILKHKGIYWDYGLNNASFVRFIFWFFNKNYHLDGFMNGKFFLRRVNYNLINTFADIFKVQPSIRYSEIFFTPDFKLPIGGKVNSVIGKLDALLTSEHLFFKLIARQCSLHVQKTK